VRKRKVGFLPPSDCFCFVCNLDFCYDETRFPLRISLAECLKCDEKLEKFHITFLHCDKKEALKGFLLIWNFLVLFKKKKLGLLNEKFRRKFQVVFDEFVRLECLPKLTGMTECFYQSFPCVRILVCWERKVFGFFVAHVCKATFGIQHWSSF
jgi:hypothetical protein